MTFFTKMGSPCCPSCCFHLKCYSPSREGTGPRLLLLLSATPHSSLPQECQKLHLCLKDPGKKRTGNSGLLPRGPPRSLSYRDLSGQWVEDQEHKFQPLQPLSSHSSTVPCTGWPGYLPFCLQSLRSTLFMHQLFPTLPLGPTQLHCTWAPSWDNME